VTKRYTKLSDMLRTTIRTGFSTTSTTTGSGWRRRKRNSQKALRLTDELQILAHVELKDDLKVYMEECRIYPQTSHKVQHFEPKQQYLQAPQLFKSNSPCIQAIPQFAL